MFLLSKTSDCSTGQSGVRCGEDRGAVDGQRPAAQRWWSGGHCTGGGAGQNSLQGEVSLSLLPMYWPVCVWLKKYSGTTSPIIRAQRIDRLHWRRGNSRDTFSLEINKPDKGHILKWVDCTKKYFLTVHKYCWNFLFAFVHLCVHIKSTNNFWARTYCSQKHLSNLKKKHNASELTQ